LNQLVRVSSALVAPGLAALLAGCASYPPERVERDRVILAAVQPCKERYAERLYNGGMMSVEQNGTVRYWYQDSPVGAFSDIDRCISEATKGLKVGPWAPGRLARSGPATVPMTASGRELLVPVRMNGVAGTMSISTSSALTMVRADYAGRAGLPIVGESPSTRARIDGKDLVVPFARVRSLEVGEMSVEALDIVVHDTHPGNPAIDGVLGNSFLALFKVNIDRRSTRLTLEPLRQP
jgi:hypothetical protein